MYGTIPIRLLVIVIYFQKCVCEFAVSLVAYLNSCVMFTSSGEVGQEAVKEKRLRASGSWDIQDTKLDGHSAHGGIPFNEFISAW